MTSEPPERLAPPSASLLSRQPSSGEKAAWKRSGPAPATKAGGMVELGTAVTVAVGIRAGKTKVAVGVGCGAGVDVGEAGGTETQPLNATAPANNKILPKGAKGIIQPVSYRRTCRPTKGAGTRRCLPGQVRRVFRQGSGIPGSEIVEGNRQRGGVLGTGEQPEGPRSVGGLVGLTDELAVGEHVQLRVLGQQPESVGNVGALDDLGRGGPVDEGRRCGLRDELAQSERAVAREVE